MPRVIFSPAMQRHVKCPPVDVAGRTVRDALDAAFAIHPGARSYVLDDQSARPQTRLDILRRKNGPRPHVARRTRD